MAVAESPFTFSNSGSGQTYASGTLTVESSTGTVLGISGTIDGQPITGLSNYGGADNQVRSVPYARIAAVIVSHYDVSTAGLGIEAGGQFYNISGQPTMVGTAAQDVTIIGSNGSQRAASFTAQTTQPICFVTGTKIRTVRGEIAVENLQVGDLAVTASGALRPIVWIGHREIVSDTGSVSFSQQPVRVRTGAFGSNLPVRDLYLSPGHPVLVGASADNEGGTLVPVMCLINGTSITREPRASVTYWHVELDAHDILLAEGLPAESYLDLGSRTWFAGADGPLVDPDTAFAEAPGRCRPIATDGPLVEVERQRLDAVFAGLLTGQCGWPASELSF